MLAANNRPDHRTINRFRALHAEALRGLFQHVNDPRRPQWAVGLKLNLPPEYLLIHRVWAGGVGVLCQIEGEVPVLEVFADWLPGFDAGALDYVEFVDQPDPTLLDGL